MFNSIPGLNPRDESSIRPPKYLQTLPNVPWGGGAGLALVENDSPRGRENRSNPGPTAYHLCELRAMCLISRSLGSLSSKMKGV